MFQFTTTNVINRNTDLTTGKPLWTVIDSEDPTNDEPASPDQFHVKRVNNFKKKNVVAIYKAPYMAPRLSKATIDLSQVDNASRGKAYRLSIYIRLDQSLQSSYYSNDMVFKGKPLSVEFNWQADEKATAEKIKEIFKKYGIAVYEKEIVKIDANEGILTITATDQYQRFHKVELEEFDKKAYHGMGEYTPVEYKEEYEPTIVQGIEGFGTYEWLLHNLRLPTTMRTRVFATNSDETPIAGAHYDEYVIHYCVNRGILGTNAVGDLVKSMTTHVFYVNHDVVEKFEEDLTSALGDITDVVTPEYLKENTAEKIEGTYDHEELDKVGE